MNRRTINKRMKPRKGFTGKALHKIETPFGKLEYTDDGGILWVTTLPLELRMVTTEDGKVERYGPMDIPKESLLCITKSVHE